MGQPLSPARNCLATKPNHPSDKPRAPALAHTTQAIADLVGGELIGPGDVPITSLAEVDRATPGQLTFIGEAGYAHHWPGSKASAALVTRGIELQARAGTVIILVDNADLAMARVLEAFAPMTPKPEAGIHPSVCVHSSAKVGRDVRIGPNCVIGSGAVVGDGCILHANVHLYDEAVIGQQCELWPGVVVRERCTLGDRCIIHANTAIGADGFGYRPDLTGPIPKLVKVPQIGVVTIGNDVEIGANSAIDRAKFDATVIGDGCKIDNLCQIGHNCRIGNMVVIAGCCAVAGSVTIGDGTMVGGACSFRDHVNVGRGVKLAGSSGIVGDIPDGATYAGLPARPIKHALQELSAIGKLPDLIRDVRRLKKSLKPDGDEIS